MDLDDEIRLPVSRDISQRDRPGLTAVSIASPRTLVFDATVVFEDLEGVVFNELAARLGRQNLDVVSVLFDEDEVLLAVAIDIPRRKWTEPPPLDRGLKRSGLLNRKFGPSEIDHHEGLVATEHQAPRHRVGKGPRVDVTHGGLGQLDVPAISVGPSLLLFGEGQDACRIVIGHQVHGGLGRRLKRGRQTNVALPDRALVLINDLPASLGIKIDGPDEIPQGSQQRRLALGSRRPHRERTRLDVTDKPEMDVFLRLMLENARTHLSNQHQGVEFAHDHHVFQPVVIDITDNEIHRTLFDLLEFHDGACVGLGRAHMEQDPQAVDVIAIL